MTEKLEAPAVRRVLIADDEPLSRERMRMLLAAHPRHEIVAEVEHGTEAVEAIARERPDIAFLDIRMPELDGLEVVRALAGHGLSRAPAVVFVTAHEEYALRAFDASAIDYLLKPVDSVRLARALERAETWLSGAEDASVERLIATVERSLTVPAARPARFLIRENSGALYFIRAADIDWVDAQGNYVRLHSHGRAHLLRDTISGFIERLDPAEFVRVHRSAIVHLDRIAKLEPYTHGEYLITMRDGAKLRTSRAHGSRLHELLG